MKVFLDTNVLVSAFATRGLCADVLRLVISRHQLIVGEVVLDEMERVLREKLALPEPVVSEATGFLREFKVVERPAEISVEVEADPEDAVVLASALAASADFLVTGDRDLLDPAVQESMLAIPYAMARLDAISQAADYYVDAVEAFHEESTRLDTVIEYID